MGKGISPGRIVVLNCKREDKWIRLGLGGYEFCKNRKQFSNRSFQITDWVNLKILKMVRPFLVHGKRTNSESKIGTFFCTRKCSQYCFQALQGLAKSQGGQSRVG